MRQRIPFRIDFYVRQRGKLCARGHGASLSSSLSLTLFLEKLLGIYGQVGETAKR